MRQIVTLLTVFFLTSCHNSKNQDNNLKIENYDNGKIRKAMHIQNGSPNGLALYYYKSGLISAIGYFKNGMAEGKWVRYYDSESAVSIIENYELGKRQGVYYQFYPSGYLHTIAHYDNDSLCCQLSEYYDHIDGPFKVYPEILPNGDVYRYIQYDTTGKEHFFETKTGKRISNVRLSLDKISSDK